MKKYYLTLPILAIFLSGCSLFPQNNSDLVGKAIEYSNRASKISNQAAGNLSSEDIRQMIDLQKQALTVAERVDINKLNEHYTDFGENWNEKYVTGLRMFIEGVEQRDNEKSLKGQVLLDEWGTWYSSNYQAIKSK